VKRHPAAVGSPGWKTTTEVDDGTEPLYSNAVRGYFPTLYYFAADVAARAEKSAETALFRSSICTVGGAPELRRDADSALSIRTGHPRASQSSIHSCPSSRTELPSLDQTYQTCTFKNFSVPPTSEYASPPSCTSQVTGPKVPSPPSYALRTASYVPIASKMPVFPSRKFRSAADMNTTAMRYRAAIAKRPFLLFGLPFVAVMVAGSFVLTPATAIRYEKHDRRIRQLTREEELEVRKNPRRVDWRDEYQVSSV